jgi:NAD(P)-dependent dehydrogenase (short-subunit alcohol dehydrogenase family)
MGHSSEARASPESRCATMRSDIVTGKSRGLGSGIARKLIDADFGAIVITRKQGQELARATSATKQTLMSQRSRTITATVVTVDTGNAA